MLGISQRLNKSATVKLREGSSVVEGVRVPGSGAWVCSVFLAR